MSFMISALRDEGPPISTTAATAAEAISLGDELAGEGCDRITVRDLATDEVFALDFFRSIMATPAAQQMKRAN